MKGITAVLAAVGLSLALACQEQGGEQGTGGGSGAAQSKSEGAGAKAKSEGTRNIAAEPGQPTPAGPGLATPAPAGSTALSTAAALAQNMPDPAKTLTVRYGVVLSDEPGGVPRAPENMTFASDTRFRLVLLPSTDVYLYLIHLGTDGSYILMQPIPGQGSSIDRLAGGRAQTIPLTGWYRFDQTPGTEKIFVIAAKSKVERMEQLLETGQPDSAAIGAALAGLQQRQEVGYTLNKQVTADYGELTVTGGPVSAAVLIGSVDLRHK